MKKLVDFVGAQKLLSLSFRWVPVPSISELIDSDFAGEGSSS